MLPVAVAIAVAAACVPAAVARVTSAPDRRYPVRLRGLARASVRCFDGAPLEQCRRPTDAAQYNPEAARNAGNVNAHRERQI